MHSERRSAQLPCLYSEMKRCLIVNTPIKQGIGGGVI